MIWKISKDQGGEQNLQIGTLASGVSLHLKFPFVSLQDKVSEKSHFYTAALQVNNKTCLSYYQKLQYFFQNSLFSSDEAKMELPPIWIHVVGLKIGCVFRRTPPNIRQGKQQLFTLSFVYFSLLSFQKNWFIKWRVSAIVRVCCIFWCRHQDMKCNCLITWLYIMPFDRYLPWNKAIAFHISMTAPK